VGPTQIVFGTDGGWTPPVQTAQTIKELLAYEGFAEGHLLSIEKGNASDLFPRFSKDPDFPQTDRRAGS
jgi:hypothetical protein